MNAQLVRIAVGILLLGGLLYFLACTPPPPANTNSAPQTAAPNQDQGNANSSSRADLRPCDYGSEPGSHAQHIKDAIKDKMGPSLKKLLKTTENPDGTFTVEVQKAENATYFVARIKGKVSGDDNLKELSNILNDFQSKQECLRVIYFLPDQTASAGSGEPGFEWSSCEYPMHVCPNGECCMPIDANTNANTPPHTNANTNANRNGVRNSNN